MLIKMKMKKQNSNVYNALQDETEHDIIRRRYAILREEKFVFDAKRAFEKTNREIVKDASFKMAVIALIVAIVITVIKIFTV